MYRWDSTEEWLDVARFIDDLPTDPAEIADLRRRALADPIYPKLIVSRDGSAAAINLSFHEISDRDFVDQGLDEKIRAIALAESAPGREFRFAGRPHVKSRTSLIMAEDLSRLIPLAVVVAARGPPDDRLAARHAAAADHRLPRCCDVRPARVDRDLDQPDHAGSHRC
jgi:hypothetical protein